MAQKWFKYLFGESGDKTAVPDVTDPSGYVSYQSGYPVDYERVLGTDPLAKAIERQKLNQVLYDVTSGLQQYQMHAFPEFITAVANGGIAFAYAVDAVVRYDDGSGYKLYQNTTVANTNVPTGAGWVVKNGGLASLSSPDFIGNLSLNGSNITPYGSFKNRIINGDMAINQIYGSTAVTPTTSQYISDQWQAGLSQPSKLTFQQVEDAPSGLKYSTKITVASQYSPLSTENFSLWQKIEGQMVIDFALGTAGAVTLNTNNYIKGSVAGTYSVKIGNEVGDRSYIGVINVTTSWTKVSITLVGDTTGTWVTGLGIGLYWVLDLGSGTTFNGTAGTWQAGNLSRTAGSVTFVNQVAGSTLNLTGVQTEKIPTGATEGTDFEFLPYDINMLRCQRYLPSVDMGGGYRYAGQATSGTFAQCTIPLRCEARVAPTGISFTGTISFSTAAGVGTGTVIFGSSSKIDVLLNASGVTTLVAGNASALQGSAPKILFTGAQL